MAYFVTASYNANISSSYVNESGSLASSSIEYVNNPINIDLITDINKNNSIFPIGGSREFKPTILFNLLDNDNISWYYNTTDNRDKDYDTLSKFTSSVIISGSLPLPAGAATSANQQTNALTDVELRATPIAVSSTNTEVSTLNSTTTPLDAAATFTGEWEDGLNYPSISLAVRTDQNGTFTIQFSPDGVNVDSTLTRYYRTNQIEAPHNFARSRRYFRVTFTNTSSANQTFLRFQVLKGNVPVLNAPLDFSLAQDFDATVVRPTDFRYEVALGRRQGATTWNKFGINLDLDIGTEVLAEQGGTFTLLTTGSTLTIVSSNAYDTAAGTGARSIIIQGVDANRVMQNEVVTLNGTTPVVTATNWLGINRAAIYLAGSGYVNAGNINITATTGGSVQAFIPTGKGTTQQCIFFTQDNHTFLTDWLTLNAVKLSGGLQPIVDFRGWVWSAVSNAKYEVLYAVIDANIEVTKTYNPSQPFIIGEKSVFWIEATTTQNNTVVSGRFSGIEFRDVDA